MKKLYTINNIKCDDNEYRMEMELNEDEIDENNVINNINELNDKFSQKNLMQNIENKKS